MELQTISQISRDLGLSTRALRYYEQIGLIRSEKKEDYAYRVYSEETVQKLRQIVILRKLRIPLKQIAQILQSEDAAVLIDAFEQNLREIDGEITALSTLRDIIGGFIARLNEHTGSHVRTDLLDDPDLLEAVDGITLRQMPLKEEKTAEQLQAASDTLKKLTDRDVRLVYLPPMTAASILCTGQDAAGNHAEYTSDLLLRAFIEKTDLYTRYPAARHFGFNNPDGLSDDDPAHGYERWITIPEDMDVPAPFVKKHLEGGLYAAHTIPEGAWDEGWRPLHTWVSESSVYDFRWGTLDDRLCGWLEEHLYYQEWENRFPGKVNQIDLLLPVQPRCPAPETNE
ncbi:MAG: effector binding domain-containing protein [Clostridia bacterium]|nr:effector binding domain-containing protein [Clostridia bacterium]